MSSIWIDMLFLHGHIHDMALARHLADNSAMPLPSSPDDKCECDRSGDKLPGCDEQAEGRVG